MNDFLLSLIFFARKGRFQLKQICVSMCLISTEKVEMKRYPILYSKLYFRCNKYDQEHNQNGKESFAMKKRYQNNPKPKKEYEQKENQGKKNAFKKAEASYQQIRKGPFYICTVCQRCFYQHIRITFVTFDYNYNILISAISS